jgi:hypothetical protein
MKGAKSEEEKNRIIPHHLLKTKRRIFEEALQKT